MKIYHYEKDRGLFLGEGMADTDPMRGGFWIIPANATTKAPPADVAEKTRHWSGTKWVYQNVPELPEPDAEPTPAQARRKDILLTLEAIDTESVRPARALSLALVDASVPNAYDVQKLVDLEAQAKALRAEFVTL